MKLITLKSIAVFSMAFMPASILAQGYVWHSVTPEEAAKAVRNFEGKPSLALKTTFPTTEARPGPITEALPADSEPKVVLHTDSIPSEMDLLTGYSLDSGRYTYNVNYYSLDEFGFVDNFAPYPDKFYDQPYDPTVLKPLAMSEKSAQAIAQAYMSRHYPDPASLNKLTVTPDYGSQGNETADQRFIHSYQFKFDQDCGNGVLAPAGCFVWVDAIKGQIIAFSYVHYPVLISPIPKLTGEEAMAAAMNALNISDGVPREVEQVGIGAPDGMGEEKLWYNVTFYGEHNRGRSNYFACIDGNTGELRYWDISHSIAIRPKVGPSPSFLLLRTRLAKMPASAGKPLKFMREETPIKLNYSPVVVSSRAYMYAGYLTYNAPGAKLTMRHGKQVTISGPTRQISLNLDSQSYQVNGQAKRMSVKPVLLNSRCYVPLDVMNAVLPGKFTYEAKSQTVRYDPPQKKVSRK